MAKCPHCDGRLLVVDERVPDRTNGVTSVRWRVKTAVCVDTCRVVRDDVPDRSRVG
jgi:hypothetical protein